MLEGWKCPVCGAGNAPSIARCDCVKKPLKASPLAPAIGSFGLNVHPGKRLCPGCGTIARQCRCLGPHGADVLVWCPGCIAKGAHIFLQRPREAMTRDERLTKLRKQVAAWKARKIAEGLCNECGHHPPMPDGKRCKRCRLRENARRERIRRAAGEIARNGEPFGNAEKLKAFEKKHGLPVSYRKKASLP